MRAKSVFGILGFGIVLLLGCTSVAKEKKEQFRIVATLSEFTEEYMYSFPIEMDGAVGHADALCPMAEFTVIEPKKEEGKKIRIIYFENKKSQKRAISKLRSKENETYEFNLPSNNFKDEYYYIESSFVTGFKKHS
jgi:hypothetical protein